MRRDLEDGIGGGVADRLPGPDMLLAELGDDLGARGVLVAEDARELRLADQRVGQLLREGRDRLREVAPVEADRDAGDLPVAGRRVLALGDLDAVAPKPFRRAGMRRGRGAARRARPPPPRRSRAGRGWERRAVRREGRRGRRRPRCMLRRCGRRCRRRRRRTRGVFGAADADRIEDDEDGAGHGASLGAGGNVGKANAPVRSCRARLVSDFVSCQRLRGSSPPALRSRSGQGSGWLAPAERPLELREDGRREFGSLRRVAAKPDEPAGQFVGP